MYKLLLSWRYLRTRWIALASIISVTLGVATLIVVNSVMAGFSAEMHQRLHSILSDIVIESPGLEGLYDPDWHMQEIREAVGDDLAGMTVVVRVPAMLHFPYQGRTVTQQVVLIGVDENTYAQVSDCSEYLLHPENRRQISFDLRQNGYDERLPESGWGYRKLRVATDRAYLQELERARKSDAEFMSVVPPPSVESPAFTDEHGGIHFAPLPSRPPVIGNATHEFDEAHDTVQPSAAPAASGIAELESQADPFLNARPHGGDENHRPFDEMNEQYTGVILGIAIANVKRRNPDTNEVEDWFLCRPGDDVQITFPTAGMPPKPVSSSFTVVDFYESKMSEYDSTFAFMPLRKLQELRGMIDPQTGVSSVTSIQVKLKPDSDVNEVRDRLRAHFEGYPYRVQTWRDLQGPLLAAVRLETVVLNILLFLIIAVAGFGILATFFMIVVEKTRDIGILKSLGAPHTGVMSIFLGYGLSLGIVGAGVGTVLGLLFVVYINDIAGMMEIVTGEPVFDPTVYYFQKIPTIIDPLTVAWVAIGSVLIAVAASVLPALRAARLHPVEALRYE